MKEGRITISRPVSNVRGSYIHIALQDIKYKHMVHIEMELGDFTQAITGQGCVVCEYETFPKTTKSEGHRKGGVENEQ